MFLFYNFCLFVSVCVCFSFNLCCSSSWVFFQKILHSLYNDIFSYDENKIQYKRVLYEYKKVNHLV